ncbi:hypothetical protein [Aquicella lusitana]|uniref:Uncharacterized protein n=1 Tax=Aquicella lusitana TaxID=254246 RepID=A0A370GJC0_9COXI|nr:hypothetical protein [Aquicella lusitana]RDI43737.1 hypothetical protein C8D86_1107 [Aquicella lusitana]VVC74532.1 hypothetical protein AQULUS_22980 [Aquicella lusitana]
MQSFHEPQSLSREICIAFLEEYLIHRQTNWNSLSQTLLNPFTSHIKARQTACNHFIDRIRSAITLEEKEKIIIDLGEEARKAQGEKIQTHSSESYLDWARNKFLSIFTKDNSLFAKTCHAVRTKMIGDILSSKGHDLCLMTEDIETDKQKPEKGKIYIKPGKTSFVYFTFGMEKPQEITNAEFNSEVPLTFEKLIGLRGKVLETIAKKGHIQPTEKDSYLIKIHKLRQELREKEALIRDNFDKKLDASKIKAERNNLFNQLLDMQDYETIKEASIYDTFPSALPSFESAAQKLPPNVKPNPNVPLVYDINYCGIFMENEIKNENDHTREHDFNKKLKQAITESKTHADIPDIMNNSYFVPLNLDLIIKESDQTDEVDKSEQKLKVTGTDSTLFANGEKKKKEDTHKKDKEKVQQNMPPSQTVTKIN